VSLSVDNTTKIRDYIGTTKNIFLYFIWYVDTCPLYGNLYSLIFAISINHLKLYIMSLNLITEETEVKYNKLQQLTYFDFDEDTISLYIDKIFCGDIKVWQDSEMNKREYICINYEIIYLDTITKN
jgi:hypothetical protein